MHDIFQHALTDGGWLGGNRQVHRISDVGRAFLGFGDLARGEFWSVEHAPAAAALQVYWPRWVDVAMNWYGCAPAFIRLLRKPAFGPLRPSCLSWILRSEPARWIAEESSQKALVLLLELVWQERYERDLTGPVRVVFERLLAELVTRQVAGAVRLSEQLVRE
jgi:hypothetical protein